MTKGFSTYETTQPWVVYHYGLTHDAWWPLWNSTRLLGYARIGMECAVCGAQRAKHHNWCTIRQGLNTCTCPIQGPE